MADITTRQQGEVDESGKVNWRGIKVYSRRVDSLYISLPQYN